jgi:7,8-dihydropterin-6-yl-methyl-4-(beta-D-ribofuranosyl)aminobenzene 5'-phosphate synthase
MVRTVSTTLLIDNTAGHSELIAEHGLSLWIEADDTRILFDTGQSAEALLHNARMLGIDLSRADAIVLSHGHYDHTGGLAAVMELNRTAPVYCHQNALVPRYSLRDDGPAHEIGMPKKSSAMLLESGRLRPVNRPQEFAPGIHLTGPIPRLTAFEDTGGAFFLDPEARHPDAIDDDLSLWIETAGGIVLVCGCCHSGIVNTLRYIETLKPNVSIRAIIGGLHLLNANNDRLKASLKALAHLSLEKIVPCHCTGCAAIQAMSVSLGKCVVQGTAGMVIELKNYFC